MPPVLLPLCDRIHTSEVETRLQLFVRIPLTASVVVKQAYTSRFSYLFTSKNYSQCYTLLARGKTRMKLPLLENSSSISSNISNSSFDKSSDPSRTFLCFNYSKVILHQNGAKHCQAIDCSLNFNLSYPRIPTNVKASQTNIVLILLSKTDELERLGYTLTSKTHGFRFQSIITSNPYSSKHPFLYSNVS